MSGKREEVEITKIDKPTGGYESVIKRVKQDVYNWHMKNANINKIYIGKTSAEQSDFKIKESLLSRNDEMKQDLGVDEIVLLYKSTSERSVNDAEEEIEDYSRKLGKESGKHANQRGGGGGRRTTKPVHLLYAALVNKK